MVKIIKDVVQTHYYETIPTQNVFDVTYTDGTYEEIKVDGEIMNEGSVKWIKNPKCQELKNFIQREKNKQKTTQPKEGPDDEYVFQLEEEVHRLRKENTELKRKLEMGAWYKDE